MNGSVFLEKKGGLMQHQSCCCCFSTGTLQGDECSRTCLCRYHPTAQLHLGFLRRKPWVTLLLHLYWRLFDHSCSVELAGSYLEHVPCKFNRTWMIKQLLQYKRSNKVTYGYPLRKPGCSCAVGWYRQRHVWEHSSPWRVPVEKQQHTTHVRRRAEIIR